jgi:PAS domain S-box-containing protein
MMLDDSSGTSEDAFQASLEDLYEHGPCGYLFTRPDGTILRMNQTLLEWTGFSRKDLVGRRRFQDLLTVAGKVFYENQFFPLLRLQGSVKEVAFDVIRHHREPLPVLLNAVLHSDAEDRPTLIASAIFDASDPRAYEEELIRSRQNAEQLAAVVRLSSDAIVRISASGIIEAWNDGAASMFGFVEQDIMGTNLRDVLTPADRHRAWPDLMDELWAGRPVHAEMVGCSASGESIDVSAGFTPHRDLLGSVGTVSVIMQNIAERWKVERLQQEFLAVTTHELRSPVIGIKGNAQLMKRRGAYSDRFVDAIIVQAQRLERLINDLLLASQIQADPLTLALKEIDLVVTVRAAVDYLGVEESAVRIEAPEETLLVYADQPRLIQVLTNLLTNAIKYSPEGADVTVRVTRQGDEAHVSVADRGIGIPPEALPRLFDRFYRVTGTARHVQGLGLGLYIARRIAEAHGGRIGVKSEPGLGSSFTVTLPLHHASAE